ncbi:hypothetical protein GCM10009641_14560 [Mycobacterium cookii]|uniref:DUF4333 domain-containing protein n=1 Tax=Mycobacterium cookii TaxID=1775 RepID=A0A7I7KZP1_9MYCO|nr:DUF4333 domain-containing protein [Mycobacterium cookii]MCV7330552.1 DUF4333 domain-containing protein [Mycobacterium cookii]BBX47257.1 hypothetical protein MCOO_32720 [Mycobacterium cookii]
MNDPRQPGPGREPRPDAPWYRRRPTSDDETGALPRPIPPPPYRRPPAGNRPPPPADIPWYLQRPQRPPPPVAHQKPTAPAKEKGTADRRTVLPWLLIGAGALALLIGAAVVVGRHGATGGRFLDVAKVQTGVLQTLSDPASGYGANTVTDVSCNNGHDPSADKGTTFTCEAVVNGTQRHVTVVVSDDQGTYEIDGPR